MFRLQVLALVAALFLHGSEVTGLVCLSCDGISQPRHCHQTETCLVGQQCAVESYYDRFHDLYFNLRCKNNENSPGHTNMSQPTGYCTEFCQSDLCNVKGCGTAGLPSDVGPICYSCKSLEIGKECHSIEICNHDEVCFFDETEEFGDILIDSGCKTTQTCHVTNGMHFGSGTIVGKRSVDKRSLSHPRCTNCCSDNLCNHKCNVRDCLDIHTQYPNQPSGSYEIDVGNQSRHLMVWCDMTTDGGGWTVFQKRFNGSVDFSQTFSAYQHGFGNVIGEYWLGLENVYQLTAGHNNSLRVDIVAYNGTHQHDDIQSFNIGPGPQYVLHVNTTSREMSYFNGHPFTTKDVDRDSWLAANCAARYGGGFWYNNCKSNANPNGPYGPEDFHGFYMTYFDHNGNRAIEMKFRRVV